MAGLYIHIPFCKQACYYCDFHFSTNTEYRSRMIDSIASELKLQKAYLNHEPISTVYFGGGTPSILEIKELEKLTRSIDLNFNLIATPEITLEANPDDLSKKKLSGLKSLGINRLSIGIQSFQDKTLKFLNRAHNAYEAIKCIENARHIEFDNLSIDLIFSIPGQSITDLDFDISQALLLNPEHISVYSLTIEDKTVFGNWQSKGKFIQVSDEESAKQFELVITRLEENSYEQYEISNFCRDSNYAQHNTAYWKNVNYLGVGPGAHSFNGKSRQSNIANNHKYMNSIEKGIVPFVLDKLSDRSMANEYLMTSLRTKWGCELKKLHTRFGYDLQKQQNDKLQELIKTEMIYTMDEIIFLTKKGKFVADEIISELFWI